MATAKRARRKKVEVEEVEEVVVKNLPERVAEWLTLSWGVEVHPDSVMIYDVGRYAIQYSLRTEVSKEVRGIPTKTEFSDDLIEAQRHECEARVLRQGDRVAVCNCGKTFSYETNPTNRQITISSEPL